MPIQYHVTINSLTLLLIGECAQEGADFIAQSSEVTVNSAGDIILILDSDVYWELVAEANGRTLNDTLAQLCRTYLKKESS